MCKQGFSTRGSRQERSEDDYEQIGVEWQVNEEGIILEGGERKLKTELMGF